MVLSRVLVVIVQRHIVNVMQPCLRVPATAHASATAMHTVLAVSRV